MSMDPISPVAGNLNLKSPGSFKYWRQPAMMGKSGQEDIVVIHVSDENRNVSRDFCCKRDILVHHMKYFESFLAENENGYDDIDISVHCDVEIFEWLMSYIHEPNAPPNLDKTMVVSILISSEFLQMDVLVDVCLQHISCNLTEIVRLPIDLSCISEKLINKLAFITSPKVLSETKDRKDKILNKLYKRRVELDFSRKTGNRGSTKGTKTIASTLTCCRHCGCVYLENYVCNLACKVANPVIDYRGKWVRCHDSIRGWSLTSYLKSLHSANMSWEVIYWHAWAACEVFQVEDVCFSALDTDRYMLSPEDQSIRVRSSSVTKSALAPVVPFSLSLDDTHYLELSGPSALMSPGGGVLPQLSSVPVSGIGAVATSPTGAASSSLLGLGVGSPSGVMNTLSVYTIQAASWTDPNPSPYITPTLSPNRPATVLTPEIFHLLQTQQKIIADPNFREVVEKTGKMQVSSDINPHMGTEEIEFDFYDAIFQDEDSGDEEGDRGSRGRSRSPVVPSGGPGSAKSRQQAHSAGPPLSKSGKAGGRDAKPDSSEVDEAKRSRSTSVGGRNSRRSRSSKRLNSIANGSNPMSCMALAPKKPSSPRAGGKGVSMRSNAPRGSKASSKGFKGRSTASPSEVSADEDEEDFDEIVQIYVETPPEVSKLIRSAKGHVYGVWLSDAHPLSLHSNQQCNFLHFVKEGSNYTNTSAAAAARLALEAVSDAAAIPGAPPAGAVVAAPPAAPVHVNSKRFEWQMDLMREFDHKRLLKFEAMLISQRQLSANASLYHAPPGNQFYNHIAALNSSIKDESANLASSTSRSTRLRDTMIAKRKEGEADKYSGKYLEYYRDRARQPGRNLPL